MEPIPSLTILFNPCNMISPFSPRLYTPLAIDAALMNFNSPLAAFTALEAVAAVPANGISEIASRPKLPSMFHVASPVVRLGLL